MLLISTLGFAEPDPKYMQLYLLIGQSNMAGRGKVEPKDEVTKPNIYMLTKDLQWVLAKDPVHFDKPIAGVGLGSEFARQIVAVDPNTMVGLIPAAMGGSSLDEWKPGGGLYQSAVTRTLAAMKNGTLAGILWHQGEADSNHDKVTTYAQRFSVMIAQLRKDLSAEHVPVIVGELGRFRPANAEFNTALPKVVEHVPLCAYVISEGLTDKGDHLHFDSVSLRILGQRYATAFLKINTEVIK